MDNLIFRPVSLKRTHSDPRAPDPSTSAPPLNHKRGQSIKTRPKTMSCSMFGWKVDEQDVVMDASIESQLADLTVQGVGSERGCPKIKCNLERLLRVATIRDIKMIEIIGGEVIESFSSSRSEKREGIKFILKNQIRFVREEELLRDFSHDLVERIKTDFLSSETEERSIELMEALLFLLFLFDEQGMVTQHWIDLNWSASSNLKRIILLTLSNEVTRNGRVYSMDGIIRMVSSLEMETQDGALKLYLDILATDVVSSNTMHLNEFNANAIVSPFVSGLLLVGCSNVSICPALQTEHPVLEAIRNQAGYSDAVLWILKECKDLRLIELFISGMGLLDRLKLLENDYEKHLITTFLSSVEKNQDLYGLLQSLKIASSLIRDMEFGINEFYSVCSSWIKPMLLRTDTPSIFRLHFLQHLLRLGRAVSGSRIDSDLTLYESQLRELLLLNMGTVSCGTLLNDCYANLCILSATLSRSTFDGMMDWIWNTFNSSPNIPCVLEAVELFSKTAPIAQIKELIDWFVAGLERNPHQGIETTITCIKVIVSCFGQMASLIDDDLILMMINLSDRSKDIQRSRAVLAAAFLYFNKHTKFGIRNLTASLAMTEKIPSFKLTIEDVFFVSTCTLHSNLLESLRTALEFKLEDCLIKSCPPLHVLKEIITRGVLKVNTIPQLKSYGRTRRDMIILIRVVLSTSNRLLDAPLPREFRDHCWTTLRLSPAQSLRSDSLLAMNELIQAEETLDGIDLTDWINGVYPIGDLVSIESSIRAWSKVLCPSNPSHSPLLLIKATEFIHSLLILSKNGLVPDGMEKIIKLFNLAQLKTST